MLGYVYYDPFQVDGDAVSYMDIASAMAHKRWHDIVNGLWNPGYPAVLALGKYISRADRMHELQTFYWVNFCIFVFSILCTTYFVKTFIRLRSLENGIGPRRNAWMLPNSILFIASYATVLLSWEHEFSLGKIRVDGLFASFLTLGFACLLRMTFSRSKILAICTGLAWGAAYLVKSPGLTLAAFAMTLFVAYFIFRSELPSRLGQIAIALIAFIAVAGPYVAALSLKKGRFDAGDSARLNYAWYASGTQPQHLLNSQPSRFGHAHVFLRHSEHELLSDPVVLSFGHYPQATYAPWFDPSYFNEGVTPRFNFDLQLVLISGQLRRLGMFILSHALIFIFFALAFSLGARIPRRSDLRGILLLAVVFMAGCFLMYLAVHFLDRYVAGMFWIASIAAMATLEAPQISKRRMIEGAAVFMSVWILALGIQSVARMREVAIFQHARRGWQNTDQFTVANDLRAAGVTWGSSVACFRACNTGVYWARLAGLHVVSEIYDPRYMSDSIDGTQIWQRLPNRTKVIQALGESGAKALVGYFEAPPNDNAWKPLTGGYYWMPLPHAPTSH